MQENIARLKLLSALVLAGLLFSGYLSGVKFFEQSCALQSTCAYFLGYPTCYYGFGMFVVLAIVLLQYYMGWITLSIVRRIALGIAIVAVLFAGYFTAVELPRTYTGSFTERILALPSCVFGLLVYFGILYFAVRISPNTN